MALRDDALACAGSGEQAQCVRLTGMGRDGAYLARLVADDGEDLIVRWEQPPRGACLPGAPGVLADLGVELHLPADAALPVAAGLEARTLDGELRLELSPGQPLWPDDTGLPTIVRLGALAVHLPGEPLPTRRGHLLSASHATGAATETSMPARVRAGDLAAASPTVLTSDTPDTRIGGTWDPATATFTVDGSCASLRLPWSAQDLLRPQASGITGGIIGAVEDTLTVGTALRLPGGPGVGRTTATVLLMDSVGDAVAMAVVGSRQDGAPCFTVRTTDDLSVPADQSRIFLCASATPGPPGRGPSRKLPPRR